mmetsp:Transcript_24552/g.81627  ORF Transcript_24552/g.81627 Transcript_24552/m.81627 type:complete len:256 (-) Transcript_24552:32-799(-)
MRSGEQLAKRVEPDHAHSGEGSPLCRDGGADRDAGEGEVGVEGGAVGGSGGGAQRAEQLQSLPKEEGRVGEQEARLDQRRAVEEDEAPDQERGGGGAAELPREREQERRQRGAERGRQGAQREEVRANPVRLADLLKRLRAAEAARPGDGGDEQLAGRRVDVKKVLPGQISGDKLSKVHLVKDHLVGPREAVEASQHARAEQPAQRAAVAEARTAAVVAALCVLVGVRGVRRRRVRLGLAGGALLAASAHRGTLS